MKKKQSLLISFSLIICLLILSIQVVYINANNQNHAATNYNSPFDLAYSPDGHYLTVSNSTANTLDVIDLNQNIISDRIVLQGEPRGVIWHQDVIFVAEYQTGSIIMVDSDTREIRERFQIGKNLVDVKLVKNKLFVSDYGADQLLVLDLITKAINKIDVPANPYYIAVTPQKNYVLVSQLTPEENQAGTTQIATLTIIDANTETVLITLELPFGSSNIRNIQVSNDGKWAYIAHTIGKTNLPVTHITKGWVNTNAISIINLVDMERYATFLLDRISEGAANPWGLAISDDDQNLWVNISGTHQVLKLDLQMLHALIAGKGPEFRDANARNMLYRSKANFDLPYSDVWFKIKDDPANRYLLENDLGALWGAGIIEKIDLPGQGLRGIEISPDNTRIATGAYYSGDIFILDTKTNQPIQVISLGDITEETNIRIGERLFHDATLAQQNWLSCATCHPNGESDGLKWDLPDGQLGNPVATKSLNEAYANYGEDLTENIRGAFWVEMITQPSDEDVAALASYIESLAE